MDIRSGNYKPPILITRSGASDRRVRKPSFNLKVRKTLPKRESTKQFRSGAVLGQRITGTSSTFITEVGRRRKFDGEKCPLLLRMGSFGIKTPYFLELFGSPNSFGTKISGSLKKERTILIVKCLFIR